MQVLERTRGKQTHSHNVHLISKILIFYSFFTKPDLPEPESMNKESNPNKPSWRASLQPAIPVRMTRRGRVRKPHELDEDNVHILFKNMPMSEYNPAIRTALAIHKARLRRQVYRAYVEQERVLNTLTISQSQMYAALVRLHDERRHALRAMQHDGRSELDLSIHSEPHRASHRALPPVISTTSPAAGHMPTGPPLALDATSLPPLPGATFPRPVDAFFENIPFADLEDPIVRANELSAALPIGVQIVLLVKEYSYNGC